MSDRPRAVLASLILFVVLAVPGDPAFAASSPTVLRVGLYDWGIQLSRSQVPAGQVTFDVRNTAPHDVHELVILKTDLPARRLPYAAAAARVEERKAGDVGEVPDLAPGHAGRVTMNLAPGHYVLICNEPGHYAAGIVATLTVSSWWRPSPRWLSSAAGSIPASRRRARAARAEDGTARARSSASLASMRRTRFW